MKQEAFVQTDIAIHKLWAELLMVDPKAGIVLHQLVGLIQPNCDPAVVISQRLLAKMCKMGTRTLQRILQRLEDGNWIQIVRLGPGTVKAYRINSRVAWPRKRSDISYASFSGTIIADWDDQVNLSNQELHSISPLVDGNVMPSVFPQKQNQN